MMIDKEVMSVRVCVHVARLFGNYVRQQLLIVNERLEFSIMTWQQ